MTQTNKPNHNIDAIIYLLRFGEYNFALTTKNLGRAGRQADRRTDTGRYREAPPLKIIKT